MRFLYTLIFSFLVMPIFGISQIYEPVDWNFSNKQISENTYELTFTADIEPGWALYSNDIYNNGVDCEVEICPIPVSFEFNQNNEAERYFSLLGDIVEVDENKQVANYHPSTNALRIGATGFGIFMMNNVTASQEGGNISGAINEPLSTIGKRIIHATLKLCFVSNIWIYLG
mgnify:CR=1 FL=1